MFGYGGGNQMGHCAAHALVNESASSLPYVEPGPKSRTGAGHRVRESCSFDSQLNVLLPRRLELTRDMGLTVDKVCMGPSNMILLCSSRQNDDENMAGMTLYEIESRRRSLGLSKLRMLSAKKQGKSSQTDGIKYEELNKEKEGWHVGKNESPSEKQNGEGTFSDASDRNDQKGESRSGKDEAYRTEKKSLLKKTKSRIIKR